MSVLTLVLMIVIAVVVQAWIARQEQAHLSIQSLSYSVSQDLTEWRIQVLVDNNGSRTATDLFVDTSLAPSSNATLTSLVILSEDGPQQVTEPYRTSTTSWRLFQPPETLLRVQYIEVLHYKLNVDRLLVGDSLVVSASFRTEASFGDQILRALGNRTLAPLTNPHGAAPDSFEHAHSLWQMQILRSHFIHDVAVAGNMIVASKSSLWQDAAYPW